MSNDKRDLFLHGFRPEDFVGTGAAGYNIADRVVERANQLLRAALAEAQVVYQHREADYDTEWTTFQPNEENIAHRARLVAIEALGEET